MAQPQGRANMPETLPEPIHRTDMQPTPDSNARCVQIVRKALAVVRPQFRLAYSGGVHGLPHWMSRIGVMEPGMFGILEPVLGD